MVPLLRPGSIVLVDVSIRKIDDTDWTTEHDRPMYFVELRNGFRCGWFHQDGSRLVSLTRFPIACRKRGVCRKRRKASAE